MFLCWRLIMMQSYSASTADLSTSILTGTASAAVTGVLGDSAADAPPRDFTGGLTGESSADSFASAYSFGLKTTSSKSCCTF